MGLITNFSSGELSANLFGRIDLPQYHSGAAHLENWDVIPTGGIKRRSGLERLEELEKEGRLIPFIINRDLNFMIYLIPEEIRVFKIENSVLTEENPIFENDSDIKIYESLEHINEVQYSQDFNTMIFCHKKYHPLEINFFDNKIEIKKINISIKKSIILKEGVSDVDALSYNENEKNYEDNKWLNKEGNFPVAVSFLNGRIVFAGTEKNPQKLFASAVNNNNKGKYDFSTSKIFLNENKKYIVIKGSIDEKYLNIINIDSAEEGLKFEEALENYYIDSPFYDPDTKIVKLQGEEITLSKNSKMTIIPQNVLDNINNMIVMAGRFDAFPNEVKIAQFTVAFPSYRWDSTHGQLVETVSLETSYIYLSAGATKLKVRRSTSNVESPIYGYTNTYNLDPKAVSKYENDNLYYYNFVYSAIGNVQNNNDYDKNKINTVIENLKNNSIATMKYELNEGDVHKTYYNIPSEIKALVERLSIYNNIYIPFYTRKIEKDEYPTPDCGFTFDIATGRNDAIRWLAVNRGLIIGTEMGEFFMPSEVHATTPPYTVSLSKYGSDRIAGEAVGIATLFFQSGCKGLVEYYPNEYDNFRANNMALLAPQMLHESPAKEFDFATNPYTKLYIVREDGIMVTLLYERMTGTFAWSRITTGEVTKDMITPEEIEHARRKKDQYRNSDPRLPDHSKFEPPQKLVRFIEGKIISCAVLPGEDGFDDVYMIVKRKIGDVYKYYLERLREEGTVYLDSWSEWKWETEEERNELLGKYGDDAVIYSEKENKILDLKDAGASSCEEHRKYIGYQYKSVFKSMPVIQDEKMKPVNMTTMNVRLLDSFMPNVWGTGKGDNAGPITGVSKKVKQFGGQSPTLQFDIVHDDPNRCCVLSVYTEV